MLRGYNQYVLMNKNKKIPTGYCAVLIKAKSGEIFSQMILETGLCAP